MPENGNTGELAVDAGSDKIVDAGDTVGLFSSAGGVSNDEELVYMWTQISGPMVELNGADMASTSFTAPDIDDPQPLLFEVTVTDSSGGTATDTVLVSVVQ